MIRLPPQPGEVIDRSRPVDFTWNGRAMSAFAGRHHRFGAGGKRCSHRVPVDEVSPTPGLFEQRLLGSQRAGAGRGRSQRPLGPPAGRAGNASGSTERLAVSQPRPEGGHPGWGRGS